MSRTNYQIKADGHVYYRGTLAQILDTRDIVVGEPTAATLPKTLNPLKFLCNNLIVNNGFVVKIKQDAIQTDSTYLKLLSDLHYVVPPEKSVLLCIELSELNDTLPINTTAGDTVTGYNATAATADTLTNNYRERIILSYNRDECDV